MVLRDKIMCISCACLDWHQGKVEATWGMILDDEDALKKIPPDAKIEYYRVEEKISLHRQLADLAKVLVPDTAEKKAASDLATLHNMLELEDDRPSALPLPVLLSIAPVHNSHSDLR